LAGLIRSVPADFNRDPVDVPLQVLGGELGARERVRPGEECSDAYGKRPRARNRDVAERRLIPGTLIGEREASTPHIGVEGDGVSRTDLQREANQHRRPVVEAENPETSSEPGGSEDSGPSYPAHAALHSPLLDQPIGGDVT
jgi:hypothetical protein